ncbi:MAG: hypothetical protein ACOCUI_00980 [bacterium]
MKTIKISQTVPYGSYVEGGRIAAKYPLSHVAVQLVREYDEGALYLIGTIEDLPGGPYGYYSTGDNVHIMPDEIAQKIRLVFNTDNIDLIPKVSLLKAVPELNEQTLQIGDTIHVNINRILQESQHPNPIIFHYNVIKEIAKTIYHEATHVKDTEETGQTSESSAEQAETPFGQYIDSKKDEIFEIIKRETGLTDEEIALYEQQESEF